MAMTVATINGLVFVPGLILLGAAIFWFLMAARPANASPDIPEEPRPEPSNDWLWPPVPTQYETRRNHAHGPTRDGRGGEGEGVR